MASCFVGRAKSHGNAVYVVFPGSRLAAAVLGGVFFTSDDISKINPGDTEIPNPVIKAWGASPDGLGVLVQLVVNLRVLLEAYSLPLTEVEIPLKSINVHRRHYCLCQGIRSLTDKVGEPDMAGATFTIATDGSVAAGCIANTSSNTEASVFLGELSGAEGRLEHIESVDGSAGVAAGVAADEVGWAAGGTAGSAGVTAMPMGVVAAAVKGVAVGWVKKEWRVGGGIDGHGGSSPFLPRFFYRCRCFFSRLCFRCCSSD